MAATLQLPEPWSCLLGQQQQLSSLSPLDGCASPRLLLDPQSEPIRVSLPSGQSPIPPASFPFTFGNTKYQAFHLPTDSRLHHDQPDYLLSFPLNDSHAQVLQTHPVSRPAEKRPDHPNDRDPGHFVDSWIDWQVWAFQELGQLPKGPSALDASTRASTVRRTWPAANSVWFRDGSKEARTALIVRLSKEQSLHQALAAVSHHPRRILQRYRYDTPIGRIQELDPACIRDYARRPGITAIQKAGSRQCLLAVLRREQRDTLENRVACWVMDRLSLRAGAYCSENSAYLNDEKVNGVRRFGRNSAEWRASEWLQDVARLPHVITQPNYPLQFESRYQVVWRTYQRLLKEKREIDDAWAWQRVLWGETGRQLVACCLHNTYSPAAVATPFYRTESRHGFWTEAPVAPGPFHTPHGDCLLFDARDLDSSRGWQRSRWLECPPRILPGAEYLGASGCDQILFWPRLSRALLVWHFYHASLAQQTGGLPAILHRCGQALETLASDARRFAQSQTRLSGLLLTADLGRMVAHGARQDSPAVVLEPGPHLAGGGSVNALCIPPDVDAWPQFATDFRKGFDLVLEELLT